MKFFALTGDPSSVHGAIAWFSCEKPSLWAPAPPLSHKTHCVGVLWEPWEIHISKRGFVGATPCGRPDHCARLRLDPELTRAATREKCIVGLADKVKHFRTGKASKKVVCR